MHASRMIRGLTQISLVGLALVVGLSVVGCARHHTKTETESTTLEDQMETIDQPENSTGNDEVPDYAKYDVSDTAGTARGLELRQQTTFVEDNTTPLAALALKVKYQVKCADALKHEKHVVSPTVGATPRIAVVRLARDMEPAQFEAACAAQHWQPATLRQALVAKYQNPAFDMMHGAALGSQHKLDGKTIAPWLCESEGREVKCSQVPDLTRAYGEFLVIRND